MNGRTWRPASDAVTPVVGTLLVLAITIMGMTAVLFWGAPAIQRIQDTNTQTAMLGQFENMQQVVTVLQVPDASRDPRVTMAAGTLELGRGTRFLVTAIHEETCQFMVTGWDSGIPSFDTTGCLGTVTVHRVTAGHVSPAVVPTPNTSSGNWLFRLAGDPSCPGALNICAQAWLHGGDRITWSLQSMVGERALYLEGGAVFSDQNGAFFLERPPPIYEGLLDPTGGTVAFFLRTLAADSDQAYSGQVSLRVLLGLTNQNARVVSDDTYRVRYAFSGDLAEAWCNTLLLRNLDLLGQPYEAPDGCDDSVPSVVYHRGGVRFSFHFIHGDVRAAFLR